MNKILLHELDYAIQEVFKEILTSAGYTNIIHVTQINLNDVVRLQPDLIILDAGVYNQGCKISLEIKDHPLTESIPIIVTSTNLNIHSNKYCRGDQFLIKPFDINHVIDLVKLYLNESIK